MWIWTDVSFDKVLALQVWGVEFRSQASTWENWAWWHAPRVLVVERQRRVPGACCPASLGKHVLLIQGDTPSQKVGEKWWRKASYADLQPPHYTRTCTHTQTCTHIHITNLSWKINKRNKAGHGWHIPMIAALRRLRQEEHKQGQGLRRPFSGQSACVDTRTWFQTQAPGTVALICNPSAGVSSEDRRIPELAGQPV